MTSSFARNYTRLKAKIDAKLLRQKKSTKIRYINERNNKNIKKFIPNEEEHYNFIQARAPYVLNCMICDNEFNEKRRACMDHCHVTGGTRGIICKKCNTGLGMFADNIKALEQAIEYLKYFNKLYSKPDCNNT